MKFKSLFRSHIYRVRKIINYFSLSWFETLTQNVGKQWIWYRVFKRNIRKNFDLPCLRALQYPRKRIKIPILLAWKFKFRSRIDRYFEFSLLGVSWRYIYLSVEISRSWVLKPILGFLVNLYYKIHRDIDSVRIRTQTGPKASIYNFFFGFSLVKLIMFNDL